MEAEKNKGQNGESDGEKTERPASLASDTSTVSESENDRDLSELDTGKSGCNTGSYRDKL